MSGIKYLAAMSLLASLLVASAAQAMTFPEFDNMASKDRQAFMDFQSVAAETVLRQEGRYDDAAKVHRLFNEIRPGDNLPVGEAELELNNANFRVFDDEKQIKDHNAPRMHVEAALAATISKNGIALTPDFIKSFEQLIATFQPKYPPMFAPAPPPRAAPPVAAPPKPFDDDPIGPGGFITPPPK